jgi:hypothetical protein
MSYDSGRGPTIDPWETASVTVCDIFNAASSILLPIDVCVAGLGAKEGTVGGLVGTGKWPIIRL